MRPARQLDAHVVVIYLVNAAGQFGVITYGKDKKLCAAAQKLGDDLLSQANDLDAAVALLRKIATNLTLCGLRRHHLADEIMAFLAEHAPEGEG